MSKLPSVFVWSCRSSRNRVRILNRHRNQQHHRPRQGFPIQPCNPAHTCASARRMHRQCRLARTYRHIPSHSLCALRRKPRKKNIPAPLQHHLIPAGRSLNHPIRIRISLPRPRRPFPDWGPFIVKNSPPGIHVDQRNLHPEIPALGPLPRSPPLPGPQPNHPHAPLSAPYLRDGAFKSTVRTEFAAHLNQQPCARPGSAPSASPGKPPVSARPHLLGHATSKCILVCTNPPPNAPEFTSEPLALFRSRRWTAEFVPLRTRRNIRYRLHSRRHQNPQMNRRNRNQIKIRLPRIPRMQLITSARDESSTPGNQVCA